MRNLAGLCTKAAPVAILLSVAVPMSALAQGARARGLGSSQGQAVPRGEAQRGGEQGAPQIGVPPAGATRAPDAPPVRAVAPPRQPTRRVEAPNRTAVPRAVPRVVVPQVVIPQANQRRGQIVRPNDHPAYRPNYRTNYRTQYRDDYRFYGPVYRPRPLYRPYYTFRPRISIGFGLWVGYPVTYPYYVRPYPYPAPYPYPYTYSAPYPYPLGTPPYPYPPPATSLAPETLGGLSFEIRPPDADVYIDGQYFGTVSQFSPTEPPLWLAPGRHRVEIQAPGYQVIAFDVDIVPGQVIPYQGDLQRF